MWLLSHTAGVLLLLIVVLAVCRWPRPGPAIRHALWLLVLLKLLTPPFVSWPWTLPILPAERAETAFVIRGDDMPLSPVDRQETAIDEARTVMPVSRYRPSDAAIVVWLCGGLVVAFVQLYRLMRFRRWLALARPAPPWLESEVRGLASLLNVRPPLLAVLPGLGSPFVWARVRACLLWPEGLEKELSPEGCRAVLAHELAHLTRRDHWVAWLLLAAGCVWWWHPLYYLIRRRLHREAELACDAYVVAALPDARRAYAEALLDVCQRQSEATVLTPALGVAGRRRDLERRLVMIMLANVPSRLSPRMLVVIGLLGLIVLPGWTLGQGETKDGKTATAEREKRLQELESKLREVLKDLEAQRKPTPPANRDVELHMSSQAQTTLFKYALSNEAMASPFWFADQIVNEPSKPVEVALTRSTYKLPAVKAEALCKFLQQHIKAAVMETKIEGDSLIVTTTPEVQKGIGQFIAVMKEKP